MVNPTVKKVARGGISAAIIAAEAAKFGVSIAWKGSRLFLGGAKSLAKQFSGSSFELGIGDALMNGTEKLASKTYNFGISQLKNLRGRLR